MSIICDFESIIVVSEENEHNSEEKRSNNKNKPSGIKRCLIVKGNQNNSKKMGIVCAMYNVHGHRAKTKKALNWKQSDRERDRKRKLHTQNDLLLIFFSAHESEKKGTNSQPLK